MAANFLMGEKKAKLHITKTVGEFLFDGYEDPLLDLVLKLNISKFVIPFKKFGWFVMVNIGNTYFHIHANHYNISQRNDSITYDGIFNMNTGGDDIRKLGILRTWNYDEHIPIWRDSCADVTGTSGELWYPPQNDASVKVFTPDLCR